ncbi:MAG: phosphate acetyltransferase [Mucispirillum sp.]|nr:phosphate acetyltransferase [Mucispirillum sp.]
MDILQNFKNKAKELKRRIVLPEGFDERTLRAAVIISEEGIARLTVLGAKDETAAKLKEYGMSADALGGINIIDPLTSPKLKEYTDLYYESRKAKGLTMEEAEASMKNNLFFGAMLVKQGECDGLVAGAANTTSDVLRSALRIIGVKKGLKTVSSCFIMVTKNKRFGKDGVLLFADSAVNPNPDSNMLADIAESTAESGRALLEMDPVIAMLSFSTKGSAKSPETEKIEEAVKILHDRNPSLVVDGEMQLDAAIIPEVGERKAKGSNVAGKANVLIFPNLDAGNIGYKLVERFAEAQAIGPIIQGLNSPVNDLSRGCSVQDIVNVAAITSVQV